MYEQIDAISVPSPYLSLKKFAGFLLHVEPVALALTVAAFWFPIEIRTYWLWLLVGVPVFMLLRWLTQRRLFTRFPLDLLFVLLITLMLLNIYVAPYTRGLYTLGRPLLGMALCLYVVEHVRHYRHMWRLLAATLVLVLLAGSLALFSSQWNSKSDQLRFIIDALPLLTGFPGAETGFNANEISGALTWLVPLSAGLAVVSGYGASKWSDRLLRVGYALGFVMTLGALFLGQSRFGLLGVLVSLALLTPLLLQKWRWRMAAWGMLLTISILEIMIVRNVFSPATFASQAARDEDSMSIRFEIWGSALAIVRDYPFSGVGMNMFRDGQVRQRYPVSDFSQSILPHAHNEFLQIGADLGLPGLLWFCGCYALAGWMLWQVYRTDTPAQRGLAAALGASLLAHGIFSLGDAVALWDRFSFVFWWMLALGCALYALNTYTQSQHKTNGI